MVVNKFINWFLIFIVIGEKICLGIVDWELLFSFYGEYKFKLIDKYFLSGWDGWVGKFLVLFFFDIILSDYFNFGLWFED